MSITFLLMSAVIITVSVIRSRRGHWFEMMRRHLYETWRDRKPDEPAVESHDTPERLTTQVVDVDIVDLMTDVAGRVKNESGLSQHLHTINSLTQTLHLRIYPSDVYQ